MKIKKCSHIDGFYFTLIQGQSRYYYGHSDTEEFYEIPDWLKNGGYQGSVIQFFDLETGQKFIPFTKERNVLYGNPIFCDGYIYFLRGDFQQQTLTLFQYLPDKVQNEIYKQDLDKFDLYNLQLIGIPVHIVSQDNRNICCYYPEPFECTKELNESLMCMENDRLYFNAWIEEGVENDRITDRYQYYDKLIVKDFQGNILSQEVGCLSQFPDGSWWIV